MDNSNNENEDKEKTKESNTTGFTEKQIEIEKLELELEIKRLELKKLELENKESLRNNKVQSNNEGSVELKEFRTGETPKSNKEKSSFNNVPEQSLENKEIQKVNKENNLISKEKFKKIKIYSIIIFVVVMLMLLARGVNNQNYYSSIEQVINPEDYYMLTRDDIKAKYGEPEDKNTGIYDFGEYSLDFIYKHGYVYMLRYIPDEVYTYKNSPRDAFYLFGLENELKQFKKDDYSDDTYRAKNDFYISGLTLYETDYEKKTATAVTIFFKENYPEREVFEGDFTSTPIIYDLVQYIDKDREYVYNSIGHSITNYDENIWYVYTELGVIEIFFYNDKVESVDFVFTKPIKYESSPQEAMVMFGVNPKQEGIYLDDYNYDVYSEIDVDFRFSYEIYKNINGKNISFYIENIAKENKTFERIHITVG